MYSYDWDTETGGYILNSSPLAFSKEPRPVYYKELDILGFDKYWKYKKDDTYPYMWAEANNYYYRGRLVAKTKGGSLYTAPELQIEDPEPGELRFVDIPEMIERNRDLLEKLVQETIRKIYNTYIEYRDRVDVFYVAFSGGKDSIVALDLVQRALPHNRFKVLFGDTGMEFPDTYRAVEVVEKECRLQSIDFIRTKSEYTPDQTWNIFGPPATVTRWCCSTHKTVPQIIALRKITNKPDFTGMAFIGVRASESLSRSEYDYISLGEKHKGQYSCNPILEWNSAELYCYIYLNRLYINEAYKKGNRRAGCLVCPRAAERNEYMARVCYKNEFDGFINIIRNLYSKSFNEATLDQFISNGGWKARKNGRDLDIAMNYQERTDGIFSEIVVHHPKTDWREWIKTIGILQNSGSPYKILFRQNIYEFELTEKAQEQILEVRYSSLLSKEAPVFIKLLKNVFRKVACCIGCKECEADCHNGFIHMKKGTVRIDDSCLHCSQCHKVEKGCLVYKSLELPNGGLKMTTKSLNCYSHHAPKLDWFNQFFTLKESFDQKNMLGSQMLSFFKRFLRDAELVDESGFSEFARKIDSIGLEDERAWALMLVNLAYTPQINWLVKRIPMSQEFKKEYILSLLVSDGAKESWVKDVWSSFARILELPFSSVGAGTAITEKGKMVAITRTPWQTPDPLVILYSLYKFAEACGDYYQFTLSRLLDHDVDSDGISPTEIFGLDRETMEKLLNGLSINYPDFITTRFTLDLDTITLDPDKKSGDILKLF